MKAIDSELAAFREAMKRFRNLCRLHVSSRKDVSTMLEMLPSPLYSLRLEIGYDAAESALRLLCDTTFLDGNGLPPSIELHPSLREIGRWSSLVSDELVNRALRSFEKRTGCVVPAAIAQGWRCFARFVRPAPLKWV